MSGSGHRILVIDDDPLIRKLVSRMLTRSGFTVLLAGDAREAQAQLAADPADLILLDWMLPEMSGIDFLKRLKEDPRAGEIPVVMVTSKNKQAEVLEGFASGADDYVSKPFSSDELLARVRAVLRRTSPIDETGMIVVGDLRVDVRRKALFMRGEQVALPQIEYRLLLFFLLNPERVHGRDELRQAVWGADVNMGPRTVDVHIANLRQALQPWGYDRLLETRRGAGCLLCVPEGDRGVQVRGAQLTVTSDRPH